MQFSMRKAPFVGGVRHLWASTHSCTRRAKWFKLPVLDDGIIPNAAKRRIVASGANISTLSGSKKHVLSTSEEIRLREWGLGAMENSQSSRNGDAFGKRRITVPVKADEHEEPESEPLDAVLVLAGGQLPSGGVPVWVERRLDKALQLQRSHGPKCTIVCLGAGTPHRRPVLTPEGFVVHESSSCVDYLHSRGAPFSVLLKEWGSYDTIGNGFFALTQHVIPRGWRRMAVVMSDFHMPRSQAIFEWVFGLQGAGTAIGRVNGFVGALVPRPGSQSQGFMLEYHCVSDDGIDSSIIQARVAKEAKALESLQSVKKGIHTLADFHEWFHTQHKCYNAEHQWLFGKQPLNDPALRSY